MKVLVTGGAGFIGSNLVRRLVGQGFEVRVFDNLTTGKIDNLSGVKDAIHFVQGDIRDPEACADACRGVDAVSHHGALASVSNSVADPVSTHDVNVNGTKNVLRAARDHGVTRFVFASSSSIYGNAAANVKDESLRPEPASPYARSKLLGEAQALAFARDHGMKTVVLRYFNVFGPFQDPRSSYAAVVPCFAASLLAGVSPTIYGDGEQRRDFTFVDNIVEANLLALKCPSEACGQTYNIACGTSFSLNQLLSTMRQRIGVGARDIEPVHEPPRAGDVRDSLASIEKARERLGYRPAVEFSTGIDKTVAWYAGR